MSLICFVIDFIDTVDKPSVRTQASGTIAVAVAFYDSEMPTLGEGSSDQWRAGAITVRSVHLRDMPMYLSLL
jgi:hypothetical protein